jgi:hypothetical protein
MAGLWAESHTRDVPKAKQDTSPPTAIFNLLDIAVKCKLILKLELRTGWLCSLSYKIFLQLSSEFTKELNAQPPFGKLPKSQNLNHCKLSALP